MIRFPTDFQRLIDKSSSRSELLTNFRLALMNIRNNAPILSDEFRVLGIAGVVPLIYVSSPNEAPPTPPSVSNSHSNTTDSDAASFFTRLIEEIDQQLETPQPAKWKAACTL